jgi:murein endopeptidase
VPGVQLLTAAAASLALMQAPSAPPAPAPQATPAPPPQAAVPPPASQPARSEALGRPNAGRLRNGVPFPPEGEAFFTWDPVLRQAPNRVWRRYATIDTVSRVLEVLAEFRRAHPDAPRIGVGDLSRPRGGVFDRRYGGLGHASHQNGLDVDVYYPRVDGLERAPRTPAQVDRALAQDLVDRFARAGATYVFVGPRLGLKRIRRSVQPLVHHDDHLHVRFRPERR